MKDARVLSIMGGTLLLIGTFYSLLVVSMNLTAPWFLVSWQRVGIFSFYAPCINIICAGLLLLAESATASRPATTMAIAGVCGIISSIVFGGIIGVIGGALGIVGALLA